MVEFFGLYYLSTRRLVQDLNECASFHLYFVDALTPCIYAIINSALTKLVGLIMTSHCFFKFAFVNAMTLVLHLFNIKCYD